MDRKEWMGLLAKAPSARLTALWQALDLTPEYEVIRAPEQGTVMVQGRTGGTGAPFNLGEMTVTRCAIRLTGENAVGHGYVQGRDTAKAKTAALVDALMQTPQQPRIQAELLDPLKAEQDDRHRIKAAKAAATKVDFFTMVRGED